MRPLLYTLICLVGCASPPENDAGTTSREQPTEMSDQSQVRVAVIDYLIKDTVRSAPKTIIFADLSVQESRVLQARYPTCTLQPTSAAVAAPDLGVRDRISRKAGFVIQCDSVNIQGDEASAQAVRCGKAAVQYSFALRKRGSWEVTSAKLQGVAD